MFLPPDIPLSLLLLPQISDNATYILLRFFIQEGISFPLVLRCPGGVLIHLNHK